MSAFPRQLHAVIFDLDGVLTHTSHLHYLAWKRLADELGIAFDEARNEELKGLDRLASLDRLISEGAGRLSESERRRLAERKNGWYVELAAGLTPRDRAPGAAEALEAVRRAGLGVALASASHNARNVLARLGLIGSFDFVVDPATVPCGKPAPGLYVAAAAGLGIAPQLCLGVEDAIAGVEAIHRAGMWSLAIGATHQFQNAHAVLPTIADFTLADFAANIPHRLSRSGQRP